MVTFLATVHIIACIGLISLVMLQDSKGGGMFSGQTSSNSVLGATGGATLAGNLTKIITIVLAITCVGLAMLSSKTQKSVVDSLPVTATTAPAAPTQTAAAAASADQTATQQQPAAPAQPNK